MNQQQVPPSSDAPLPDSLSLTQLLNLSLKTPDYGVVNFRSLYVLLEYLINRMNVAGDRVDLRERPSRDMIREAGRGMTDGANGVVDYRDGGLQETGQDPFRVPSITTFANQQRIAALEQNVGALQSQMGAFYEFLTNARLSEKSVSGSAGFHPSSFTLNIIEPSKGSLSAVEQPAQSNLVCHPSTHGIFDPTQPGAVRMSGPMIEAWQMAQLVKRLDAAEQATKKAFSMIDEVLQGLGKIRNLKDNLINYIRKWMLNPEAAFQDALNGDILTDSLPEDFVVPSNFNKLPFVTWPALRAVLVDRQNEDAKMSLAASGQRSRSPSGEPNSTGNRSLSPIAERKERERLSKVPKISSPKFADDQTSTRSEEEKKRVSIGANRLTPESQQSDEARRRGWKDQKTTDGPNLSAPADNNATALANQNDPAEEFFTDDAQGAAGAEQHPGTDPTNPTMSIDVDVDGSQNQRVQEDSDDEGTGKTRDGTAVQFGENYGGSPDRSQSTRRSTPVSMLSNGSPKSPTLNNIRLSGSSHVESPLFITEPDADVLSSLVQIGRLVRTSHRFEKRLGRIEIYLNGLAHKKDIHRLTDGIRSDFDNFRRSLTSATGTAIGGSLGGNGGTGFGGSGVEEPDGEIIDGGADNYGEFAGSKERTQREGTWSGESGGGNENEDGRQSDGGSNSGGSEYTGSPHSQRGSDDPSFQTAMDSYAGRAGSDGRSCSNGQPGSSGSPKDQDHRAGPSLSPLSALDVTFTPVGSADGMAMLNHIRDVQKALDQQKKNWERMQNRVNTLHTELASVTTKLKEQAIKLAGSSSRVLIQPQVQQDAKSERSARGTNGPTRSEFEIFCRACAENFEMIEVRLTDLENIMRTQQSKLEVLQFQTTRLQREKADEVTVNELLLPKADTSLLDNKLDKPHFMEFANVLQQKLMDIRGNMLQQGDFLGNHIKDISERLETQLNSSEVERKIEKADQHIGAMEKKLTLLEKCLQVDSAAGSKKPIRAYTCVSCDKPVDPTPSEKPAGWPHAFVTSSVRPHLEYIRHQMVQHWDGNEKIGELKYKNASLSKRFLRHIREQECIDFKEAANHFGHSSFPHCNHNEMRPSGGRHTQIKNQDYQSTKTPRRHIEDRLDSFIKRHNLQVQFPRTGKDALMGNHNDMPGFPDMRVGPLRKPKSADSLIGPDNKPRSRVGGYDAKYLEPGMQRRRASVKRRKGTVLRLAIELPRAHVETPAVEAPKSALATSSIAATTALSTAPVSERAASLPVDKFTIENSVAAATERQLGVTVNATFALLSMNDAIPIATNIPVNAATVDRSVSNEPKTQQPEVV
ncbi:hypothetical protein BV898_11727 [Hypsibius exemplaris]|uniref:DUF4795 domain-containing protein n=1 Tax=Hypsibius exemplaris TaxID=2072580 RepID=A0A1W0WFU9_HYPEX|nr:hypothetical protein BV898_11727 [Hypsibius exemplaris]